MKTFQRPNFALYFRGEDRLLSELSRQDVLLIKSSMTETELKDVWIYHPSQRDWIPIEQNQEIFNAPFEFQRNVKSPQPRLPDTTLESKPPQSPPLNAHAAGGRSAPQNARPPMPRTEPVAVSQPETRPAPRPQASSKPTAPPVLAQASAPHSQPTEKPRTSIPTAPKVPQAQELKASPTLPPASKSQSPLQPSPAKESPSSTAESFKGTDVQKFGIIARAIKFSGFQAQILRLDAKHLQSNQPWPFDKGQAGVLKLSYLNQDYTLEGSVDQKSEGKILVLKENLDYLYFKDLLHFLGVG